MRPPDTERCAVCIRDMVPRCNAADLHDPTESRTHLQFMWDRARSKSEAQDDAAFEQELIAYALNRMLAPFRDNKNKKEGKQADRIYKSRNTKTANALALKCHVRRGPVQCMRNAGHEGEHRF
jgi:hypothetical protein